MTRLINENKAEYKFAYDPLDRLIHEQGIDGLITGYEYDPVGNLTQKLEDETGKAQRATKFLRRVELACDVKYTQLYYYIFERNSCENNN